MSKHKQILFILMAIWACACVEPFETLTNNSLDKLVVDATLTERIRHTWQHYVEEAKRHRAGKYPVWTDKTDRTEIWGLLAQLEAWGLLGQ